MNRNPFSFTQPKEFELWHKALQQYKTAGKKILVVSAQGSDTSNVCLNGIRYVNLSEQNSMLKIRILGDNIQYQIS
jgi:hypothetical protein